MEPKVLATMSQAELSMRMEADAGIGKGRKGGRQRRVRLRLICLFVCLHLYDTFFRTRCLVLPVYFTT